MKILFDTNVVLDLLLSRKSFYEAAAYLLSKVEEKQIEGYLCPTTVTTIAYLVGKYKNKSDTKLIITHLLNIFQTSPINKPVLETALNCRITDYEDAVIHESASQLNLDGIVTRDLKDFKNSSMKIYDPKELVGILKTYEK
jgi:predicted nucleic acid-binding protein